MAPKRKNTKTSKSKGKRLMEHARLSQQQEAAWTVFIESQKDDLWRYAKFDQRTIKSKGHIVHCSFCDNHMHGGINRFKFHLARVNQRDVTLCSQVPDEVRLPTQFHLEEFQRKEKEAQLARIQGKIVASHTSTTYNSAEEIMDTTRSQREGKRPTTIGPCEWKGKASTTSSSVGSYFQPMSQSGPEAQQTIDGMGCFSKDLAAYADKKVSTFFYRCCIPFKVARSPHFKDMVEAISAVKGRYEAPSYEKLRGKLLGDQIEEVKAIIEQKKKTWSKIGCTIMTNRWKDTRRREFVNFLVSNGQHTIFLRSVDVTHKVRNASFMTSIIKEVIEEVGPSNVVQIITNNASACVKLDHEFELEYPHIFWTPCAAHSLDLLLEDLGKLPWIKEVVDNCERITKFIYSHGILRSLFLRHSKGKEILRPGATRFVTHFLSLRSLLDARVPLGFTFISEEWIRNDDFLQLRLSIEGVDVTSLVKESYYPFWSTVEEVVKISKPLVRVLRLVDGDRMSMGYIYEAMERAKESIKTYYKNNEDKFQPIWNIIEQRWNKTLHKPIHGAAHLLNPSFFYEPNFNLDDIEIRINFREVVEKMYPKTHERVRMYDELYQYINQAIYLFSKDAVEATKTVRPDAWWDAFGFSLPNLRKFACTILSQPTSASACERNWSMFNNMQAKKRHLLSSKRLNDLVFVNFNMLLQESQLLQKNTQVIHLEDISLDPPLVEAITKHLSNGSDDDTLETPLPDVNPSYVSYDHKHDSVEGNDLHLDEDWDALD